MKEYWIYLLILSGSTYLIRAIPFALVEKKIENRFIRSFLHYIPYAVLSVMAIPAIFTATGSLTSAAAGFAVALLLAWKGRSLLTVAAAACAAVLAAELIF